MMEFMAERLSWRAQITSLFLHWFPLLVVWTERWHMRKSRRGTDARDWETASLAQLVFLPMGPYLLWAMMYYIKVKNSSCAPGLLTTDRLIS